MKLIASLRSTGGYTTLIGLGMVLLASGVLPARTTAHGPDVLVKTDPPDGAMLEQSPAYVMAWFNTELDARLSALEVVDVNDRQVDNGAEQSGSRHNGRQSAHAPGGRVHCPLDRCYCP
jgi:methionine-rich copper-binding protein CopC